MAAQGRDEVLAAGLAAEGWGLALVRRTAPAYRVRMRRVLEGREDASSIHLETDSGPAKPMVHYACGGKQSFSLDYFRF